MKSNKLIYPVIVLALIVGCSGGSSSTNTNTPPTITLFSIAVTPANPSIAQSTTETFIATGTYSDNSKQNITTSVTWSTSVASVATITNGKASAVAAGQTTITATSGSISGSTTLTVTSATIASLAVTPANPTIFVGATKQFTATGTFSDNTNQNLTSLASWSSSSLPVATISNTAGSNGLVNSLATGTTTIAATWGGASDSTLLTVNSAPTGSNVLTLTVDGSNCSASSYQNKPCVSVQVCSPGTSTCQIISDILLDTGSTGLRIFKSLLVTVPLNQVISGSGSLTECVQYADGSSDWGPVQTADVILGNEPAVTVPIQVIDSTFGKAPSSCGIPDTELNKQFNGILGLGLFTEDCGTGCANIANNGVYYVCSGTTCTSTTAPVSNQVQNPVARLPVDNNGVILQLPSVSSGGTTSVSGSLVLGIGTQANNSPSGVTTYGASSIGEFITVFNSTTYNQSFIDSGSNALYFPAPSSVLPACTGLFTGWFCPSSTTSLNATNKGSTGSPSNAVAFDIGNATNLFNSGNSVFSELGGSVTGPPSTLFFDWGLPFFLGRSVYVGIEGKTSSLGTGPYWAY
jgi:Protein of unknown function (DUF3443)/Bacterial Ig-like domain (group 2)